MASTSFAAEKLLLGGCGSPDIVIMDKKSGDISWRHKLKRDKGEDCLDAELTKEGNLLYAYTRGARMVDRKDEKVLWDFKCAPGQEVYTATQLKDGHYFVAMCGKPSRAVILDKEGKILKDISFETKIDHVHGQFRQVLPLSQDKFLVPVFSAHNVTTYDGEGKAIGEPVPAECTPFGLTITKKGHWIMGGGDTGKIVIVDPKTKKPIKTITSEDTKPHKLLFVSEIRELKNGNLLVVNWKGHSGDKTPPALIELTPEGKVVWTLDKKEGLGDLCTAYVFDE